MAIYDLKQELDSYEIPYEIIESSGLIVYKKKTPEIWSFLFEKKKNCWVHEVLKLWERLKNKLPEFYVSLKKALIGIELVVLDGFLTMIYVIKEDDYLYLYYGSNPNERQLRDPVVGLYSRFPKDLQWFYENLHDGFGYVVDASYGPLSSHSLFTLAEPNWETLKKSSDYPFNLDLDNSVAVYADEGLFLVLLLPRGGEKCQDAIIWKREERPVSVEFWITLDGLMSKAINE